MYPAISKTTRKNCFTCLKLMSPLNAAICTTISYTLWVELYYLKNNYLTLRSKAKVPWSSVRYTTHRLKVMHSHTKYNWPIWRDKKVMVRTGFAEKNQNKRKRKPITDMARVRARLCNIQTRGSANWTCIAHLTIEWYWSKFQREIIITLKNSSYFE